MAEHTPPYVRRTVVFEHNTHAAECCHRTTADEAYWSVALDLWFNAEARGKVPSAEGNLDRFDRTTKRLSRWLAWVDARLQEQGLEELHRAAEQIRADQAGADR